jgi:hypothetical protein
MKNSKQQFVAKPYKIWHLRLFAYFSIVSSFVVFASFSWAQVNVVGSKEERATDAKGLTEKTSEKPATPADRALLEVQLQALVDAYERGDVGFFQAKIDPSMPGYSRVLDSMRRDATSQTRPRLLFTDQTWSIGPNVAMLQARFQKRYFDARNINPELIEGRVVMLLSRDGDLWRISAVTGDNPFESKALAPCSTGLIRLISPANANTEPFFVEVDDADLAGVPSIQADILTDRGDREFLTLTALNPAGLFRAQVNVKRLTQQGVAVPGNNTVDLIGDALVTARYADQCIAVARTQQIVTASDVRRDPGVLGQLACRIGGNTTFVGLATASANAAVNAPISIELNDPDLAGLPSTNVILRTAAGDSEAITLGAVGNLGRFLASSMPARAGTNVTPVPNNGVLELGGATLLSVEYNDARGGIVGQSVRVNADCGAIASGYQTAQLGCSIGTTLSDLGTFVSRNVSAQVSLVDPDLALANPASVDVTITNSLGDRETLRLTPQGSGRYGANSVTMNAFAGGVGDGVLNFPSPGSISIAYTDSTTASGSPQNLAQSCGQVTQGFTLATLNINFPNISASLVPRLMGITVPTQVTLPCNITVTDPDLTGPSVSVQLTATQLQTGRVDSETITLPRTAAGVYSVSQCTYDGYFSTTSSTATVSQPVPGNNVINLGGGSHTITVRYIDTTAPSGGSQAVQQSANVAN